MRSLNSNAMIVALKNVISLCGVYVLADENRFQAAIRDFLHSNVLIIEQQLLIFSVKIGIGEELLKAVNKTVSEQNRMLIVAENLLTVEYGFIKERSDEILNVFISALGWQGTLFHQKQKSEKSIQSNSHFSRGMIISFGRYKWRILYVEEDTALLITDEITDIGLPFDNAEILKGISWENSSLRKWLNNEFLNRFSEEQKRRILKRKIVPENNPWFQTNAGNMTEDKVFLLSVSEVIHYFGNSGHLKSRPTNSWVYDTDGLSYAVDDRYNAARQAAYKGENTWWWLRTPGDDKTKVAYVNPSGIIFLNGELAFDDGGTSCVGVRPGVRPAIFIELD